jgi:hypothetical protein
MLKTITAGLLALLAWTTTPASAANIVYNQQCNDGKAGCYYISIDGEIKQGDAKTFTDLILKQSVTTAVYLNSPGGSFEEGMAIARLVHQSNLKTLVDDGDECTSMCAIIWLAGTTRYYGGKAKIGFHSIANIPVDKQGNRIKGGKATPYNAGNALVGAFYSQLGLSEKAIEALTDADPSDTFYLNTKNVEELGISAQRLKALTPSPSPSRG